MKVPDSGMPEESYWNSLFDIPHIIEWLELHSVHASIVEVGSGYGTFAVPVAKQATGIVHAFDIEPSMIDAAQGNAQRAGIQNVLFKLRDVCEHGTGLPAMSVGLVLLFNILHFEQKRILLEEADRVLTPGGRVAIIHWRKDIETPRGPRQDLRPDQQIIFDSILGLDLHFEGNTRILEPYHWGIQLNKGRLDADGHRE